jgi:CRISPR-associated endonuclease/helicase Cas3
MITSSTLWAKLKRDQMGRIIGWHSLADHSADVAAVVEALLLQLTIRRRLATAAGRTELDEITRARLSALSFLHEFASTLHHSRFGPEDRRLLDTTVQQQIGRHRPTVLIVVGTQTLEQSLDLDADLLLTDLCPIDVLLQRIGRAAPSRQGASERA